MQRRLVFVFVLALSCGCSKRFEDLPVPEGIKTKLNRDCVKALENASQFEVLSIDPGAQVGQQGASFRGYRLLGKTVVKDKRTRRQVADAIYASVNYGGASALCFDPRHVVRVSVGGKSLDFVICFECDNMHVYPGSDEAYWHYPVSDAGKSVLNQVLTDAGVPLAR